jgi:D-sedoheptulose 7-phosphate isomerase
MSAGRVRAGLEALTRTVQDCAGLSDEIAAVARRYAATLRSGRTLFFCGNGGSAADAQHLATEYVVRYAGSRRALSAIALTTDTSLLTAAGNDLGFDQIFARQVEAVCRAGDLLVLHSTSGRSANLVAAARAARAQSVATVGFLGRGGGELAGLVDAAIVVPADDTGRIQVVHLALEHLIVELVEEELARGT